MQHILNYYWFFRYTLINNYQIIISICQYTCLLWLQKKWNQMESIKYKSYTLVLIFKYSTITSDSVLVMVSHQADDIKWPKCRHPNSERLCDQMIQFDWLRMNIVLCANCQFFLMYVTCWKKAKWFANTLSVKFVYFRQSR